MRPHCGGARYDVNGVARSSRTSVSARAGVRAEGGEDLPCVAKGSGRLGRPAEREQASPVPEQGESAARAPP